MSSIEEWEEEIKTLRPAVANEYAKAIEILFQWKMFNKNYVVYSGLTIIKKMLEQRANNEKIDHKSISTIGWKDLSPEDEITYRQWAIDNWYPNTCINPLWHPVVRDEWCKLDEKYKDVGIKHKVEI